MRCQWSQLIKGQRRRTNEGKDAKGEQEVELEDTWRETEGPKERKR